MNDEAKQLIGLCLAIPFIFVACAVVADYLRRRAARHPAARKA